MELLERKRRLREDIDDRKRRDISINPIIWHANNHKFIDRSYETRLRENILLDQIIGGIQIKLSPMIQLLPRTYEAQAFHRLSKINILFLNRDKRKANRSGELEDSK